MRMRRADEANARVVGNKDKLARQDQQLSDYEAELNLLRRRCESVQGDHDRYKKEIIRLQDALNRARIVRTLTSRLCAPVTSFCVILRLMRSHFI
jgi:chromosome segregation ATPase